MAASTDMNECNSGPSSPAARWDRASGWVLGAILLLTVVGLPLARSSLLDDNFLGKWALSLVLCGAVLLIWSARAVAAGRFELTRASLYIPVLVFLGISALALLPAPNRVSGCEVLLSRSLLLVVFAVVAVRFATASAATLLMATMALAGLAVAAIGLLQSAGFAVFVPEGWRGPPVSTLSNPMYVAHFLDLAIPVTASLLVVAIKGGSKCRGVVLGIALASMSLHMVLTGIRGGWLSILIVAAVATCLARPRARWLRQAPIALLVLALLSPVAGLMVSDAPPLKRAFDSSVEVAERTWQRALTSFDEQDMSRSLRLLMWSDTVSLIKGNPLMGVGIGGFEVALPDYRSDHRAWNELVVRLGIAPYFAHNEYLELGAEVGVFGLAAFLWFAVGLTRAGWRGLTARQDGADDRVRILVGGCLFAILAALVHALFSFNLQDGVSGTYFWILAGLLVGLTGRERMVVSLHAPTARFAFALVAGGLAIAGMYAGVRILAGNMHYATGLRSYNAGEPARALASLRRAVEWRGSEFSHHHMVGFVAFSVQRFPEAEAAFRRSLELHPSHAPTLRMLGKTLLNNRRGSEAVRLFKRLVELEPLNWVNYDLSATALRQKGDHVAALRARQQALAFRPQDVDLLERLGTEYFMAGSPESAVTVLERASMLQPTNGLVHGNLGGILMQLGEFDGAETALRIAVEDQPLNPGWRQNLVTCLMSMDRLSGAMSEAERAIELFPDNQLFRRQLKELRQLARARDGDR